MTPSNKQGRANRLKKVEDDKANPPIDFKDLTYRQFQKLQEHLAKTSYKQVITQETVLPLEKYNDLLRALGELPFKDVNDLITIMVQSGTVQAQKVNEK